MSFIGAGDEDWVDFDLEGFELERHADVAELLALAARSLAAVIGDSYEIEPTSSGAADILVRGQRRFTATITAAGRLVLTAVPDPEGPL